jgi:diguanylate cyclase (GGDEF)-like protein/PAS domain S-box-containing protein
VKSRRAAGETPIGASKGSSVEPPAPVLARGATVGTLAFDRAMEGIPDAGRRTRRRSSAGPDEPLIAPAAILEGLPDAVVAIAADGRIVFVNELAENLFGYRREELVGEPVQKLWPERVRDRYTRNMQLYVATRHPLRFSSEAWGLRRDGSEFVGEMSWGIVTTDSGPLLLAIGRDISERRATEARLRALAEMGERALGGAGASELAAEAVTLIRTTLPVAGAHVRLADGRALASDGPTAGAARLPIGTGDELLVAPERGLTDEETSIVRAVANTLATALARLRGEERMRHEAVHDPLTGLANRTLLRDRLEHACSRSVREGGDTAVLFIDLDNFKLVNDVYGHSVGDAVLAELAARLRTAVRPADTVGRFGGDEFVVVCEQVDEPAAVALAGRLLDVIAQPVTVAGVQHRVSSSIGLAIGHGDSDRLLADADAAVYDAKAVGGRRVEISSRR